MRNSVWDSKVANIFEERLAEVWLGQMEKYRGYETFCNHEGQKYMQEWGVPDGYSCQGFVILGYIDGEQPHRKPRKPGRIKIIEG